MKMGNVDIKQLLVRGVEEVIVREHLEKMLRQTQRKLRVKFGIDPTAPDLHLGHSVPLRKLRQFQDAGHTAVLIIGDFTAMIGDPTGRSDERKFLTKEEVKSNLKKYLKLAGKIIDIKNSEVHYNNVWFADKDMKEMFELARSATVQQVLHRADFKRRLDEGHDVSVAEILYPILQGYDSVQVKADLEIGGTDQKFNLLMGRQVQKHFGLPEQDIMTLPLLEGTDGVKKMSKSAGNYIALDADPEDMFGKIMRVPDQLIDKYYTLLTDIERKIFNPREAKLELGRIIVNMYHGNGKGERAKENFIRTFSKHEKPLDVPKKPQLAGKSVLEGIIEAGFAKSKGEVRRLIEGRAIKIDGKVVEDSKQIIPPDSTVQIGRRYFFDT